MMRKKLFSLMFVPLTLIMLTSVYAQENNPAAHAETLTLDDFIRRATENDTRFEQILIDELNLQYQKALQLPADDLVLSIKQQHEFFLDQERDSPDTSVSLSRLFPKIGTQLDLDYASGKSISSSTASSSVTFALSQPLAENAFGRSTRWLDKIVGLEIDVARHQIVEAYEDYMAAVTEAYYDWYEAYENQKVAESSYQSNLKLQDNILERQKQKIALDIDVNKVKLQVLAKKERLVDLQQEYQSRLITVQRIIRYKGRPALVPENPHAMGTMDADFDAAFEHFRQNSRTFAVLNNLEEKSTLAVARDADDLLPSIDLLLGYEVSGKRYAVENENNLLYAGVQFDWPFGDQEDKAEYELSKISQRKTKLSTDNTYHQLYSQLKDLYLEMKREQQLITLTDERIALAESILDDEAENYSFGKITLNDYIQAVNALDTNRFGKITHESLYKKLLLEWLRLSDQLVQQIHYDDKEKTF